jgi:hypothetical protein
MTIYCDRCDKIPHTYIVIDRQRLCMKCASVQYNRELKAVHDKFLGVGL